MELVPSTATMLNKIATVIIAAALKAVGTIAEWVFQALASLVCKWLESLGAILKKTLDLSDLMGSQY